MNFVLNSLISLSSFPFCSKYWKTCFCSFCFSSSHYLKLYFKLMLSFSDYYCTVFKLIFNFKISLVKLLVSSYQTFLLRLSSSSSYFICFFMESFSERSMMSNFFDSFSSKIAISESYFVSLFFSFSRANS